MLLLEHDDIAGLLPPEEIIAAVREALLEQSKSLVQVPPRTTIEFIVRLRLVAHDAGDPQRLKGDGL